MNLVWTRAPKQKLLLPLNYLLIIGAGKVFRFMCAVVKE